MQIDFYFDPLCPRCWTSSRWITEVAARRDLDLTWRSFSLALRNDPDGSKGYRPSEEWGLRGLRVVEAVRRGLGEEAVARVYAEMGARKHNDGTAFPDHADVLSALFIRCCVRRCRRRRFVGCRDPGGMDAAFELAGDDVGVPTIVYEGRTVFFGPVIPPAPTGGAALRLWDALATLATTTDGFFELKRTRQVGPIFGERPRP